MYSILKNWSIPATIGMVAFACSSAVLSNGKKQNAIDVWPLLHTGALYEVRSDGALYLEYDNLKLSSDKPVSLLKRGEGVNPFTMGFSSTVSNREPEAQATLIFSEREWKLSEKELWNKTSHKGEEFRSYSVQFVKDGWIEVNNLLEGKPYTKFVKTSFSGKDSVWYTEKRVSTFSIVADKKLMIDDEDLAVNTESVEELQKVFSTNDLWLNQHTALRFTGTNWITYSFGASGELVKQEDEYEIQMVVDGSSNRFEFHKVGELDMTPQIIRFVSKIDDYWYQGRVLEKGAVLSKGQFVNRENVLRAVKNFPGLQENSQAMLIHN